jgi:hypothetical protein
MVPARLKNPALCYAVAPNPTVLTITSMSRYFETWAIYKYVDYLIGKLTVSGWRSRYCNWPVVFIKVHIDLHAA